MALVWQLPVADAWRLAGQQFGFFLRSDRCCVVSGCVCQILVQGAGRQHAACACWWGLRNRNSLLLWSHAAACWGHMLMAPRSKGWRPAVQWTLLVPLLHLRRIR